MLRLTQSVGLLSAALLLSLPARAADPNSQETQPDTAKARISAAPVSPQAAAVTRALRDKLTLASIKITGDYPEDPQPPSLFGEQEDNLKAALDRIDKARRDSAISGLILKIDSPSFGWAKLQEFRRTIERFRKSGKKTYAILEMAGNQAYLLATACDEIVMPESGWLMTTGVRAETMFFKGLFDWLGIQADMMQMGKYKGAAEPYTRTSMSPALREELSAVLDDYYAQLVETVATARKLSPEAVKAAIDEAPISARRAAELKLIDRVAYPDQLRDALKQSLETKSLAVSENYGKKKLDTDFSGLAGFMKLMTLLMGGETEAPARSTKPKVAVIYASGMIVDAEEPLYELLGGVITADTIVKAIKKAADDPKVVAIVLRVDSPGGSALASDLIWRELVRQQKPVIASMSDTAASGGYYIAMGARKIFAGSGTLTGSIGVLGGKLALKGLFAKVGITVESISRGKNAGALSSTDPFTESERAAMQKLLADTYDQFVSKAAQGRKMDKAKLEELAQGRIWTGQMAVKNGLVDQLGTLDDAVVEAKTAAGLAADEDVELLILPKPKSVLEQLLGPIDPAEAMVRRVPALRSKWRQIHALTALANEPLLYLMPALIEIK